MTASLIFAGKPATRDPILYAPTPIVAGWYHVVVGANEIHPVMVAATEACVRAGGGDRLDPGDAADLFGFGVWVMPAQAGGIPFFSVELRNQWTPIQRTGAHPAMPTAKVGVFRLEPNTWRNFSGGIDGLLAYKLRAEGGTVWWGSHVSTTYPGGAPRPPSDPSDATGAAWPLRDGCETDLLPGNQNLWAWTYDAGVTLRLMKFARDYDFTP